MVGVFNGAFYIDNSTSKPTFANSVAASTTFGTDYNTGSNDGIGFVNDNPQQEYVCKADAAVAQLLSELLLIATTLLLVTQKAVNQL